MRRCQPDRRQAAMAFLDRSEPTPWADPDLRRGLEDVLIIFQELVKRYCDPATAAIGPTLLHTARKRQQSA
jgi:hypothetical protein